MADNAKQVDMGGEDLIINNIYLSNASPFNRISTAATTGLLYESATGGITAHSGGGKASAVALSSELNRITTAAASSSPFDSVLMPAALAGLTICVINKGANPIQVFGQGTDTIDGVATGTGVTQMNSSMVIYSCTTAGSWDSEGLGTGYSGSLQTFSYADGITAATGGQGSATPLTASVNTVSTVASTAGVNLPSSAQGLEITVINTGANPLTVYPAQGASDTINGVAAATGVQLFPGSIATFNCTAAGAWTVQPASTKASAFNTVASATSLTLTAANVTGGFSTVDLGITGTTAITTFTTPSAASIVAALHAPTVGTSYRLRIINAASGATTSALTAGSGVTMANFQSGVQTIANAGWREWVVSVTAIGTPAVTFTSVATGTWS